MLLAERDSHGNVQVIADPDREVADRHGQDAASRNWTRKVKFAAHSHFFGYEGRCGAPTLFDAAYTYNLGLTAGSLVLDGRTGYIAAITDLTRAAACSPSRSRRC